MELGKNGMVFDRLDDDEKETSWICTLGCESNSYHKKEEKEVLL